jgi:hypothetical protein
MDNDIAPAPCSCGQPACLYGKYSLFVLWRPAIRPDHPRADSDGYVSEYVTNATTHAEAVTLCHAYRALGIKAFFRPCTVPIPSVYVLPA